MVENAQENGTMAIKWCFNFETGLLLLAANTKFIDVHFVLAFYKSGFIFKKNYALLKKAFLIV